MAVHFFFSGKRILRKFAKSITKIKLEDLHRPDVDDIGCLQVAEIVATVTSPESSSGTTLILFPGFSYL